MMQMFLDEANNERMHFTQLCALEGSQSSISCRRYCGGGWFASRSSCWGYMISQILPWFVGLH
jgi:hypothetical protein